MALKQPRFVKIAAVLWLLVVIGGGGVLARWLLREDPVPLWTEQDLPPIPGDAENGWSLIRAKGKESSHDEGVDSEVSEILHDVTWASIQQHAQRIRDIRQSAEFQQDLLLIEEAIARPRFADACPNGPEAKCPHMAVLRLHDMMELSVLATAFSGDWERSFASAERLLRADLDFAKSSRGMLSTMIGVENLLDTLRLLRALADGLATTHGTPPTQERLANIRRLLVGDGDNEIDARRAVVGEYLFVANTVRMMAVASMRKSVTHKLFSKILFDPPHTLELVKPYFSSLMAFAEDPSEETAPPLPRFSRVSFGWWSYNAMGKLVLDASMGAMTPPLQKFADDRAEFISLREKVRMRLIAP